MCRTVARWRWPIPHSRSSWHLSISWPNKTGGGVIWDVFAPPKTTAMTITWRAQPGETTGTTESTETKKAKGKKQKPTTHPIQRLWHEFNAPLQICKFPLDAIQFFLYFFFYILGTRARTANLKSGLKLFHGLVI